MGDVCLSQEASTVSHHYVIPPCSLPLHYHPGWRAIREWCGAMHPQPLNSKGLQAALQALGASMKKLDRLSLAASDPILLLLYVPGP